VHKTIQAFAETIVHRYGSPKEHAFLFSSHAVAARCVSFFRNQISFLDTESTLRIIDLYPIAGSGDNDVPHFNPENPIISAVLFPKTHTNIAKTFWQHSGDGVSSRRAEYCHKAFKDGHLEARRGNQVENSTSLSKGPRRYQKKVPTGNLPISIPARTQRADPSEGKDCVQFVEERFGRNLDISLANSAKLAIRRRIAGALTANVDLQEALKTHSRPPARTAQVDGFSEDDVYLYPCGMSSIFNTHRIMMAIRGQLKSVSYGCVLFVTCDSGDD